ncbi:MAG: hypothetical protein K5Q68_04220 [Roseococcus sp.]|nr:hypothetical protein [Roseococcus sp.]
MKRVNDISDATLLTGPRLPPCRNHPVSLEIGEAEADRFVAAVSDFIEGRGSLLQGG